MASLNPSGEMIVQKAEKNIIAGAHNVFTFWTKSRVLLDPLFNQIPLESIVL